MKVTLDGQVLHESSGGWALTVGTAPHARGYVLPRLIATDLYNRAVGRIHGSVLVLDATAEGRGTQTVEALTILGTSPANHRDQERLIVVDRRWTWGRLHVARAYNMPRRTGARRRLPGAPVAVAQIDDDLAYAPWSLRNGARWTGLQVLRDVLTNLGVVYHIEPDVAAVLGDSDNSPVQALELDDPGDVALARVLAYFGRAYGVYVDYDGRVVVFNRLSGGERDLVGVAQPGEGVGSSVSPDSAVSAAGIGDPYEQTPHFDLQDRRQELPSRVLVHFTRRVELRIDVEEGADPTVDGGERAAEPPTGDYVVALPEDATIRGQDYVLGTYVDLDGYLEFLAGKQLIPTLPDITLDVLRTAYASPAITLYSVPKLDVTGIWGRRIRALRGAFRQRIQLRKRWLDRVRGIKAERVAIINTERGSRGPATVFTDYAEVSFWREIEAVRLAGLDQRDWRPIRNRFANPNAPTGGQIIDTPIEDLAPAPVRVLVEDEDQGILFLQFERDFTGQVTLIYPTALEQPDGLPEDDPRASNQWLAFADATVVHQISVIVTVGMGAPNSLRKFHTVPVTASDVLGLLPNTEILGGVGPEIHVRVQSTTTVARFGWQDEHAQAFYRAWAGQEDLTAALGDPINVDEVNDQARAFAARVYASLANRVEGQLHTGFVPGVVPAGTTRSVAHEFGAGRGATTVLDFPSDPPPRSPGSFLSMGTRRIVERLVE